ncbi:NAD(P)/FAD-dependent oxidoreductase [Siminovitchia sediminis]|uniref:NAD(P)/FAD-dependent oxidoreductase n=1 Tax=Siminovitchia sediminis TaxID=1274353 RepID=A0ABW4KMZ3_9BACI
MSGKETTVIIGGGIAGVHAAQTLRSEGCRGDIVLFDSDETPPYDRPPLSKEYMLGKVSDSEISIMSREMAEELNIQLKLGVRIDSIHAGQKEVKADDGRTYNWDKLLLATGSKLRKISIPGDHLDQVFYLKKLSDARKMKEKLPGIKSVVLIGAGFIGAELASSFKSLGIHVTMIEKAGLPMARILGREIGRYFLQMHEANGVNVITGDSVAAIIGKDTVEKVVTVHGQEIDCQAVVIGIGVEPNTEISHPELKVDRGYVVNEYGETSIPGIFAAGDCTVWPYKGNNIHVEHWDHAVYHAQAAAKNMIAEKTVPYHRVPYFWSDQYGQRFQYAGHTKEWENTVLRGDMEEGKFTYFYLDKRNIVTAALMVNTPRDVLPVRKLIDREEAVDPALLADSSIAIKKAKVKSPV